MKLCIDSDSIYGTYIVVKPDLGDPTETIINIPDEVAEKWLVMQDEYNAWQKEVKTFYEKPWLEKRKIKEEKERKKKRKEISIFLENLKKKYD